MATATIMKALTIASAGRTRGVSTDVEDPTDVTARYMDQEDRDSEVHGKLIRQHHDFLRTTRRHKLRSIPTAARRSGARNQHVKEQHEALPPRQCDRHGRRQRLRVRKTINRQDDAEQEQRRYREQEIAPAKARKRRRRSRSPGRPPPPRA
jgi:hypothetical protein